MSDTTPMSIVAALQESALDMHERLSVLAAGLESSPQRDSPTTDDEYRRGLREAGQIILEFAGKGDGSGVNPLATAEIVDAVRAVRELRDRGEAALGNLAAERTKNQGVVYEMPPTPSANSMENLARSLTKALLAARAARTGYKCGACPWINTPNDDCHARFGALLNSCRQAGLVDAEDDPCEEPNLDPNQGQIWELLAKIDHLTKERDTVRKQAEHFLAEAGKAKSERDTLREQAAGVPSSSPSPPLAERALAAILYRDASQGDIRADTLRHAEGLRVVVEATKLGGLVAMVEKEGQRAETEVRL